MCKEYGFVSEEGLEITVWVSPNVSMKGHRVIRSVMEVYNLANTEGGSLLPKGLVMSMTSRRDGEVVTTVTIDEIKAGMQKINLSGYTITDNRE